MLEINIFILTFLLSSVSLIGILTFLLSENRLKQLLPLFVALSAGAMLGGFFIHILPELAEKSQNFTFISIIILTGILLFYLLEKIIYWHSQHHTRSESRDCSKCLNCQKIQPLAYSILSSSVFHNFTDGLLLGSAFLLNFNLGLITFFLILLHKIPREIGNFSILLFSGLSKNKALLFNFLASLPIFIGVFLSLFLGKSFENLTLFLTALVGGMFLYISLVNLIPELHNHQHSKKDFGKELFFIFLGIILIFLL